MIKKIGLENFRIFKEYNDFEIRPLTILTGANNSGKSVLSKMLFLLSKSIRKINDRIIFDKLNFSPEIVELIGHFKDNINYDSNEDAIKITFLIEDSLFGDISLECQFSCSDGNEPYLTVVNIKNSEKIIYQYKNLNTLEFEKLLYGNKKIKFNLSNHNFSDSFLGKFGMKLDNNEEISYFISYIHSILMKEKEKLLIQNSLVEINKKW